MYYLQLKAFLSFPFCMYKLIYDLFFQIHNSVRFPLLHWKLFKKQSRFNLNKCKFYIHNYLTNMLSKKAYKYTDPNAYQKGNKTNEKINSSHTSIRSKRSSEVLEVKKQGSKCKNIEKDNKNNEERSTQKQLYKMHYTPKLTSFMLADSNVMQKQEQNEEASGKNYCKQKNQQYKYKRNSQLYRNQQRKSPFVTTNNNSFEQTQTLMAVSDNIRSFIQEFIYSIKDDESMSLRLEQAVQNLLMRMLNVATLISGMASYYSHISQQSQKNDPIYKKCKQVNTKQPIQPIQSCIRIQDSQLSKFSYQQTKYRYSQREMEMINNASRQLPILCQDPSAEDLLSSCQQPYYQNSDQYGSQYEENQTVSANMSQQNMSKSDKQYSQSNKSYGYSNFVDNLFTKQNNPKSKQPQNNSFLKNKYQFNQQYGQPSPSYNLPDNHSDISKSEYSSKQQSILQSQSDVGVEEGASCSSIHLCSLQARSNNYHSSYNFKKGNQNSHKKQSHEKYRQSIQDKDQMMQNSISEYYIQQSPININKNSISKNVSEIKSKRNHSPISYTYQQSSPIHKSQKNQSHSSSNIVTNININRSNKYNKQNKSPYNCLQTDDKDNDADCKNVSPNSNNYRSSYHSKQKYKRYSDIYSNNRIPMASINPTNNNGSQNFNHLFGHKGPNPSSHVTTNTQGYIVSQVLSRRKIF